MAALISSSLRRKDSGDQLSNFSDNSRTAVSPRVSMSFRVASTVDFTLASKSAAASSLMPGLITLITVVSSIIWFV
jgi:hypothetical protein